MYKLMPGLLTCLVLAGCNGGGSDSEFAKTDAAETAQSCPSNMTCGFMPAPKSYDGESSEMVEIYYGIHKAQDPANRIGSLLLNFGGPSAEAVQSASWMAAYAFPQEILDRFDIVGMDPRGTGQSAFAKELTECAVAQYKGEGSCDATYQQVAPYLGSNTVVKDMDRLRQMLGDDKLTFLGYSYGTRLGSLYANTFPDNVRAIVLDSPMSPTKANNVEIRIDNAAGYEKVADFRLGYNAARNDRYQAIVDSVSTGPDYLYYANDGTLTLAEGMLTLNLTTAKETSGDWQDIKSGLIDLLDNDNATSLKWGLNVKYNSSNENSDSQLEDFLRGSALFKAVVCTDERAPLTDSEIAASENRYMVASPLYGLLTHYQTAELCKGWTAQRDPIPAVTDMASALGGQQILIIGGQYDPATPYTWAQEMVANFGASASLVTVDNYVDHAFSYTGIGCIDQNTTAYLLEPDSKIADQTCNAPVPAFGKSFAIAPGIPHPAKDVIGW